MPLSILHSSLPAEVALPAPVGALRAIARRWSELRIGVIYRWRHGSWPALAAPRTFTEWVQWRKLNDRSPALARLTDKLHAKRHAAARIGDANIVPALWQGRALPAEPPARLPLVVKAAHGCNQYRIVRTAAEWRSARRAARRWLGTTYGGWLDEWHYRAAVPAILVEPLVGPADGALPNDYKFYVFGGRVEVVQAHVERATRHRWSQFDRHWQPLCDAPVDLAAPDHLAAMIAAAETLASGHDFLRVDFFDVGGKWWFGEYCLFPGSGLDRFRPAALDRRLGRCWARARAAPHSQASPT